ncbi:MAG: ATP-binding protein [Firmicutes bacterium]|nr:ATP-binding protein [Bacillota bacterium]
MNRIRHTLLIAVCIALASQFNLSYFVKGFIITLSVVLLPVFLYNYSELNSIIVGFATGIISPLFRGIIVYLGNKDINLTIELVGPDVFFYFTYGLVFYFLYYKSLTKDITRFVITAFACDFLSNIVEMSIRTRITDMSFHIIKDLITIATIRAIIVLGIVISMKYYRSFLIKEEHESRYRKLMLLTSGFKSEIYFMNKNVSLIEDVMKRSYNAYKMIYEGDYPKEVKNLSLDIAKDVHEIKKDYIRIIKGLEAVSKDKIDYSKMSIKDVVNILETDTKEYIKDNKLDICIYFSVRTNFYIVKHFYLMSILNNLINNGIEAIGKRKRGKLSLIIYETGKNYIFEIKDNGKGIKESDLDYIYNPGFSTKFDENTGNIERGIGLALVSDLIKGTFDGDISVNSEPGKGTAFRISISKDTM